jgi:hypothetical protein
MRELNLEACHERKKLWKDLWKEGGKNGVRMKREGGEKVLPSLDRERMSEMRYFWPQIN